MYCVPLRLSERHRLREIGRILADIRASRQGKSLTAKLWQLEQARLVARLPVLASN
jgi:hypothetical protein